MSRHVIEYIWAFTTRNSPRPLMIGSFTWTKGQFPYSAPLNCPNRWPNITTELHIGLNLDQSPNIQYDSFSQMEASRGTQEANNHHLPPHPLKRSDTHLVLYVRKQTESVACLTKGLNDTLAALHKKPLGAANGLPRVWGLHTSLDSAFDMAWLNDGVVFSPRGSEDDFEEMMSSILITPFME